jgi:hypothetical protein
MLSYGSNKSDLCQKRLSPTSALEQAKRNVMIRVVSTMVEAAQSVNAWHQKQQNRLGDAKPLHEYCKNDKIACGTCESNGICPCSDEQVTSGFRKNDSFEVEQEMRTRLREFESRRRELSRQGLPAQTSQELASYELLTNTILQSQPKPENQLEACGQAGYTMCPHPDCFFKSVCSIRRKR